MCWNHNFFVNNRNPIKSIATTGLPESGEPEFLSIGILRKPHGINGEMKFEIWTDFPERLTKGAFVFIGEIKEKYRIASFKARKERAHIRFEEIGDPQSCLSVVNKIVYINTDGLPDLENNLYYHHQIIGLDVFTKDDVYLGKIKEIIRTGSNDVYVIQNPEIKKNETLIPVIPSVIMKIDLTGKKMIIDPPQWA
jgi:16S rRNA processing protein RimM